MDRLSALVGMPLLSILLTATAHAQGTGDRDYWWHSGWGLGHMMFGGLMMIVFWGGVILLIVLLVRWIGSGGPTSGPQDVSRPSALEILQERFAKGEIDEEEYRKRKALLSE